MFSATRNRGFTLIELLVVVAIIGVLAAVVLAALNSARSKGTAAAIKSNLKNAMPQAELSYNDTGNYSNACTSIAPMLTGITDNGVTPSCLSYNNPGFSDVYLRWGASGLKNLSTPLQAWSANPTGAVTWDIQGVNSSGVFVSPDTNMTWDAANTACTTAGGRLPTIEELKTLVNATYTASGNTTYTIPGFVNNHYWSQTVTPSNSTYGYTVYLPTGGINIQSKPNLYYVRCVR